MNAKEHGSINAPRQAWEAAGGTGAASAMSWRLLPFAALERTAAPQEILAGGERRFVGSKAIIASKPFKIAPGQGILFCPFL